jgi:predicted nucleic acid-binding protein
MPLFRSAVANTTVLIAFAQINRMDVLKSLVGIIHVPSQVYVEIITPDVKAAVDKGVKEGWIKVETLSSKEMEKCDRYTMEIEPNNPEKHIGEAAAITLHQRIKPDILILDELKPRQVARTLGIQHIVGTLGLFLAAQNEGLVTAKDIKTYIDILVRKGTKISKELRDKILSEAKKK